MARPIKFRSGCSVLFFAILLISFIAQPTPVTAQLKGTASYRERIALTAGPDARHVAMTFMACPEEMETERDFGAALEQTKSGKILGDRLELFDSGGVF